MMTVLTIRGVGDELSEALRREAKLRGVSMNTLTRELLRRGLGFTEATAHFGAIDPGLWE